MGKRVGGIKIVRKLNEDSWSMPDSARSVFEIGSWEALHRYAISMKPGVYACPQKTYVRPARRSAGSNHFKECFCRGSAAIRIA